MRPWCVVCARCLGMAFEGWYTASIPREHHKHMPRYYPHARAMHLCCRDVQLLCRLAGRSYLQIALTQTPLLHASRQAGAGANAALHVGDTGIVVKRLESLVHDPLGALLLLRASK